MSTVALAQQAQPFEPTVGQAGKDVVWVLSPQALLQVYRELHDEDPPPCTLLALRGLRFELGEPPSAAALAHLVAALQWAVSWLSRPQVLRRA